MLKILPEQQRLYIREDQFLFPECQAKRNARNEVDARTMHSAIVDQEINAQVGDVNVTVMINMKRREERKDLGRNAIEC